MPSFALFNIGGGEIILILVLLFILALVAVGFFGLIYLIVRAVQNRPPPPIPPSLPSEALIENQRKRDHEHLRLLSIFHFVFTGLAILGIAFLFFHYFMLHTIFSNPDM